jgi:hypothetical protein
VDNLGGNTNSVNNFIIGSIYGYPEEKGKKKIVGILQLVNKLSFEDPITDYDKVSGYRLMSFRKNSRPSSPSSAWLWTTQQRFTPL